MSHSASTPIPPAAPTSVKKVQGSIAHNWGVGIAIFIGCLLFVSIAWYNHKKNKPDIFGNKPKTEQTGSSTTATETFPAADAEYNLANVSYDQILEFEVSPGKSAMVRLTNDWCPDWASDQINVLDQRGEKRVLYHYRYVQGPATAENITYWLYKNSSQNSITVKIGRCTSQEECKIDFFKNK